MPATDTITVTGRARRRVLPDLAIWSAATETRGETQRAAFATCSESLTALLDAVAQQAGDGAEVSAGGVYVSPEWDERGRTRTGFVAGASVTIRAGLEEAARLGQAALDAGAIRLDGPTFEIADADTVTDELLAQAVAAAKTTADAMAEAAGRTVGRTLRITDGSDHNPVGWGPGPVHYARSAMEMQADAPPLEPGAQELSASATVEFELLG